jgi:hypothetical protein
MNLIQGSKNQCVAASVGMLFEWELEELACFALFDITRHQYPFPHPWSHLPKVASMEEICEWAFSVTGHGLVPFPRDPTCAPSADCPPQPVFKDGERAFRNQLVFGAGLLEGRINGRLGHMCAWDGMKVYDPRGYIYQIENADDFEFTPTRFWLSVPARGDDA